MKIALINVVSKLNNLLTDKLLKEIHDLGSIIAHRYVSHALKWGYRKAAQWINDEAYIFHLIFLFLGYGMDGLSAERIVKLFEKAKDHRKMYGEC